MYDNASSTCGAYLTTLDATDDPRSFQKAIQHPKWCGSMNQELRALEQTHTWKITLLLGKDLLVANGCLKPSLMLAVVAMKD